ncbi:MAG TPA: serine/threonine-protein kinase [Acidimicrobiales bacterium]|nr:serine/threonine-protein kinase [Acidimicrobiales bacterium]
MREGGSGTQRQASPGPELGIGGYEDAVLVGEGAFAVVYRARQVEFSRVVAVKILSKVHMDDQAIRRFHRERGAMGALAAHPNIVTVYESGLTTTGSPYLTMEYLSRGTLADRLRTRGRVNWREVLRVGVKLSGALETAHEAGVLHRDIKPENVLLSAFDEPQLADFGIARVIGEFETQSAETNLSVPHAPPEVIEGKRPSEGSDIYSLASTLFALIWGRPAFLRDTDESLIPLLARIVNEPVPDLRVHDVPPAVCAVLEKAMAKDPLHRHGSALEFGEELRHAEIDCGLPPTPLPLETNPTSQLDALHDARLHPPDPSSELPRRPGRRVSPAPAAGTRAPSPQPPTEPDDSLHGAEARFSGAGQSARTHGLTSRPPTTPSLSGHWPNRRVLALSVLAALLGVTTVAILVLRSDSGDGRPSATATSGPSTTATTTTAPSVSLPANTDPLPEGLYLLPGFRPTTEIRLGQGWRRQRVDRSDVIELVRTDGAENSFVSFLAVEEVVDPSRQFSSIPEVIRQGGGTAAPGDLRAWLQDHPRLAAGPVTPVKAGRVTGHRVDLEVKAQNSRCTRSRTPCVALFHFKDTVFWLLEGNRNRLYLFPTGSTTTVISIEAPPEHFDRLATETERVLSTLNFR